MAKLPNIEWRERFDFLGQTWMLEGKGLNVTEAGYVRGMLKGILPNYGGAEQTLITAAVVRMKRDGQTVWKQGDGNEKLPRDTYDPETKETIGEAIMKTLITRRFAQLADKHPEAFEDYYDEEYLRGTQEPSDPNPTDPTPAEPTPFASEGETYEASASTPTT